jgi:hypothetical protein
MTAELLEGLKQHKGEILNLLEPPLAFGNVPRGWRASDWADRLEQLAGRCERLHPDKAARYRRWAAVVRSREQQRQVARPPTPDRSDEAVSAGPEEIAGLLAKAPEAMRAFIADVEAVFGEIEVVDLRPPDGPRYVQEPDPEDDEEYWCA